MGKASRDKGARGERALRDELVRLGWSSVSREGWKQVRRGQEESDDVIGTAPDGNAYAFENKARATGFDKIYGMLGHNPIAARPFVLDEVCYTVSLNLEVALNESTFYLLEHFSPADQKVLRSIAKKCTDWIGNADILSLKQDRKPFIFIRVRQ